MFACQGEGGQGWGRYSPQFPMPAERTTTAQDYEKSAGMAFPGTKFFNLTIFEGVMPEDPHPSRTTRSSHKPCPHPTSLPPHPDFQETGSPETAVPGHHAVHEPPERVHHRVHLPPGLGGGVGGIVHRPAGAGPPLGRSASVPVAGPGPGLTPSSFSN